MSKTRIKKVVIPVAGLGTRGLPFTKEVPKELLPVIDTPAIHFIVEEVIQAGIEQVIFVTGKGKHSLEDYFDPSPHLEGWLRKRGKDELAARLEKIGKMCEVISVRQKEPLGLGHAVLCAKPVVGNEPFAVCLGDEIYPRWDYKAGQKSLLERLVDCAATTGESLVGVAEIPKSDSLSYGIIDVGGKTMAKEPVAIVRTVEKPQPEEAPSHYAIIGRYVFEPVLFEFLAKTKPGKGGEIQLTDGMDLLAKAGKLHGLLNDGPRYDVGSHLSYVQAVIDAGLRRPDLRERLMQHIKGIR